MWGSEKCVRLRDPARILILIWNNGNAECIDYLDPRSIKISDWYGVFDCFDGCLPMLVAVLIYCGFFWIARIFLPESSLELPSSHPFWTNCFFSKKELLHSQIQRFANMSKAPFIRKQNSLVPLPDSHVRKRKAQLGCQRIGENLSIPSYVVSSGR